MRSSSTSSRKKRMLSAIVPAKSNGSCGTNAKRLVHVLRSNSPASTPLTRCSPSSASAGEGAAGPMSTSPHRTGRRCRSCRLDAPRTRSPGAPPARGCTRSPRHRSGAPPPRRVHGARAPVPLRIWPDWPAAARCTDWPPEGSDSGSEPAWRTTKPVRRSGGSRSAPRSGHSRLRTRSPDLPRCRGRERSGTGPAGSFGRGWHGTDRVGPHRRCHARRRPTGSATPKTSIS